MRALFFKLSDLADGLAVDETHVLMLAFVLLELQRELALLLLGVLLDLDHLLVQLVVLPD